MKHYKLQVHYKYSILSAFNKLQGSFHICNLTSQRQHTESGKYNTFYYSMLGKNFSRWHFEIFFLFFPENRFDS